MEKDLKFRISLEDLFSKNIENASHHAEGFDHHVISIREHLSSLTEQAVQAFGIFETFELLKGSAEEFVAMDKAAAQLAFTVGMRGGVAGSLEELTEQSDKLGQSSFFNHVEIQKAQNELLNFGISVDRTKDSIKTLTEVGVAKGQGLEELIQRIAGAAATGQTRGLNRAGFGLGNLHLEKAAGDIAAENRNFEKIVNALQGKFTGATTSFSAHEFFKLKKIEDEFAEFKEKVGKQLLIAFDQLLPYLKKGIEYLTEFGHFVTKNKDGLLAIGGAILATAGAIKVLNLSMAAFETISAGIAITPLGAFVTTVGALAAAWIYAREKYNEYVDSIEKRTETAVEKEIKAVRELAKGYEDLGESRKTALEHAISTQKNDIQAQINQLNEKWEKLYISHDPSMLEKMGLGGNSDYNKEKFGLMQQLTTLKAQLHSLKDSSSFTGENKKGTEGGLDSGLSEPKASKIQNITFNIIDPLKNQKVTIQGDMSDAKNVGQNFVEILTSLITDAAVVATE